MNEIDEFYSYVEMPQVAENLKAWTGSFPGGDFLHNAVYYIVTELRIDRMDPKRIPET